MSFLNNIPNVSQYQTADEEVIVAQHQAYLGWTKGDRNSIQQQAAQWVEQLRQQPVALMDAFMAEYGLSNHEGIALMQLAEALLRVPDAWQKQRLIKDKISHGQWQQHVNHSPSQWVNWASRGLSLAGKIVQQGGTIESFSQPAMALLFDQSMRFMGKKFVMAQTIHEALLSAKYPCSFDMLGEAALTAKDAQRYFNAYRDALLALAVLPPVQRKQHGLSVKLSALSPLFKTAKRHHLKEDLLPRLISLAELAASIDVGLNIDAEESERLPLTLTIFEQVLQQANLGQWSDFGLVVQAYNMSAPHVIDHVYDLSRRYQRRVCVRLVKGAYWDREIKHAQVQGLENYPVYTSKAATDIAYMACAKRLLAYNDGLYAQFATHNAHTIAAIEHLASAEHAFEYQRLFGMGEGVYEQCSEQLLRPCRVYAPIGQHHDLLAYLVRRMLENSANANFVNLLVRKDVPVAKVVEDPFVTYQQRTSIIKGHQLFEPQRLNSIGFDVDDVVMQRQFDTLRKPFRNHQWQAGLMPILSHDGLRQCEVVYSPVNRSDVVGRVYYANEADVDAAFQRAMPWSASVSERSSVLNQVADMLELHRPEFFALLHREAGKTLLDAHAELREAVDFLRFYAANITDSEPLGRVVCISPWNFPLAICCGQIAAALACGNAVLAKPAEQTCLVAARLVECFYAVGVPQTALQLLPGLGEVVGSALCSHTYVDGVVFTGSLVTAQSIRRDLAHNARPGVPLIAETGGINAMLVDSTAHLEQAVQAILESAFQSAGQRCSALRCVYVQDEIYASLLEMLTGAMDCLTLADPWDWSTDIGPLIDDQAAREVLSYIAQAGQQGQLLHQLVAPQHGCFVPPTILSVAGIEDIPREVFGPVLHIARYRGEDIERVLAAVNATGYGLTFGLHSRLSSLPARLPHLVSAGNVYVNRNQIGAVVESQPFGGEGLSGTGPKAGGPHYLARLCQPQAPLARCEYVDQPLLADVVALQLALSACPSDRRFLSQQICPGPTGEANTLFTLSREPILCLGPNQTIADQQADLVRKLGGVALAYDALEPSLLETVQGISGVMWWGNDVLARRYQCALAKRQGPIIPLICAVPDIAYVRLERHLCVDTTAASGNTDLLQQVH